MSAPNLKTVPFARPERGDALSLLCGAAGERVKRAAEDLLPLLGNIEVMANRTGLVMQPYRETAHATTFFLGEVLVAEAHIRCLDHGVEGYAMLVGRDLEQAMAVAVLDAIGAAGIAAERFDALIAEIADDEAQADIAKRRQIEATRVQMETF